MIGIGTAAWAAGAPAGTGQGSHTLDLDFLEGRYSVPLAYALAVARLGPAFTLAGPGTAQASLVAHPADTPRVDAGGLLVEPAGANAVPSPGMQGASTGTVPMPGQTGVLQDRLPTGAEIGVFNAVAGSASYTVHAIQARRGVTMMDLTLEADYAGSGPVLQLLLRPAGRDRIATVPGQTRSASVYVEATEIVGTLDSVQMQQAYYGLGGGFLTSGGGAELAGTIVADTLARLQVTSVTPANAVAVGPQLRFACQSGPARRVKRRIWWGVPQSEIAPDPSSPMPGGGRAGETVTLNLAPGTYEITVTTRAGTTTRQGEVVGPSGWVVPAPGPVAGHRATRIVATPA